MNDETLCETCGGLGFYEVDRADSRGEHYTDCVTCLCSTDDGDDERDDAVDVDSEVVQEAPL